MFRLFPRRSFTASGLHLRASRFTTSRETFGPSGIKYFFRWLHIARAETFHYYLCFFLCPRPTARHRTIADAVCLRRFLLDAFVLREKASLVRLYSLFLLLSPGRVSCRSDYSATNLFAVTTPAGNYSFNYHHLSALWFFREGVSTLSFFETQTSRQEQLRASAFIFRLRFITVYSFRCERYSTNVIAIVFFTRY